MKPVIRNVIIAASPLASTLIHAETFRSPGVDPRQNPAAGAFAAGTRVLTNRATRLWVSPPTAGVFLGQQATGAAGRVVAGPVRAANGWWWQVDFDSGLDGWASQRDLRPAAGGSIAVEVLAGPTVAAAPAPIFFGVNPVTGSLLHSPNTTLRGKITHDIYPPSAISATMDGKPLKLDGNGNFSANVKLAPGNNSFSLQATTPNPRQQITEISAYLDASMIYGSDPKRANALRSFTGGALKTSAGDLPPLNTAGFANDNSAHIYPDDQLFLAGDVRANENLELTAIHTLFVREHNQIAAAIAAADSKLSDERIYQKARALVTAEVQSITYNEFLPALLGDGAIRPYRGYNPNVNSGIATEFSTGAYRIGHTLINDDVEFLNNDGKEIRDGLPLAYAFFNPQPLKETGPGPLLKYLATDNAREVDTQLVGGLRDFLFGPPGAGGLDLASLNIQRGRDHGIADYNTVRVAYGLPAVTRISQITSDVSLQGELLSVYHDLGSLDLWVGGLAEDHVAGSSVGPTFRRIIAEQFERTRDGDSNWYEGRFSGRQLAALKATRLSDIIRRNTEITKIQDNVFFYFAGTLNKLTEISGSLSSDLIEGPDSGEPAPSLDGTGNNRMHPNWGAANTDLLRNSPAAYSDGFSQPAGADRPGARLISNTVSVQTSEASNARSMSSFVYGWGQFIDHDLGLTTTGDTAFDIPVPTGDPSFDPNSTGTEIIPMTRSNNDPTTGTPTPSVVKKLVKLANQPRPPRR